MSEQKRMEDALHTDANDPRIRTRAAVAYLNTSRLGREDPSALEAFMAIFHPEVAQDRKRMLELRHAMRKTGD